MTNTEYVSKNWMSLVLKAAALYNWTWGVWVILFPANFFEVTGMEQINHTMIWQGMGMIVGVYGFGYWWASFDPVRHWPVIAVGMLGKLFGPIGFVYNYAMGDASGAFMYTLITNDLIWWVPFAMILFHVHRTINWRLTG